jgi:hypothetical protein
MTRRHFIAVAGCIHRSNELAAERLSRRESIKVQESNLLLAEGLGDIFYAENGRFDRGRFMRACGFAS